MYIKENQGLKFQFLLGDAKNCLGSSVSYYQARERFSADLKAWEQMPKASPSPFWYFRPKLMFLQQKSLNFSKFQQFSQTNFSFPDLTRLTERFYCIHTGRTLF